MGILKNKILLTIILSGFTLRMILIPLPGFRIDVDAWFAWAIRLNEVGFSNFYSDQVWTNYTPGFLYILAILGFIKNLLHINNNLFYLLLKLPSIISEIILGIFLYQLISKKTFFWATIALLVTLLNPAFIFNSAVWGQIDGLLSFLMLLSIYFLSQKKLILSSVALGLSFLIKPQAISLLPILGLYLVRNLSVRNSLQIIFPVIVTIFVLSLPFFTTQPISGLPQLFSKMVSDYSYVSLFAYNFWGVVGFWINDNILWNPLSYQQWGYIIYTLYLIFIAYLYLKGKLSLYSLSALATLSFFFLPTRVHERYLYPAIIFLIFLSAILKSRLLLILNILLSFTHFLNLYYVYVYYNEFYLKLPKTLYLPFLYNFLDTNGKAMSLISTALFLLISITILKSQYEYKKS